MNMLAIIYGNDFLIRKTEITASNLYVNDYIAISHPAFGFENLHTISLQNLHAQNYYSHSHIFYIGNQREIRIKNATFENVSSHPGSSIKLQDFGYGYLEDITFRNYTGATQSNFPALFIVNSSNPLELRNFIIENCEFYNQAFMESFNPLEHIIMSSIAIMNTTLSPNSAIINVLAVKQIQADDISLSGVTANNPTGTDISFIKANSFNLDSVANSEVTNSWSVNSSMSFLTIESFIGTTAPLKLVKHQNITFRDTQVQSQSALVDMNRIISPQNVKFSFENITFSNIKFTSSGYLFKFDHQLPTNVAMTNCLFENIENGYILVVTPAKSDSNVFTRVEIDNATVDNVKAGINAFITLAEESKVYIKDSAFSNLYSYSEGSVVYGGSSRTASIIEN